ncbi:MAG: hypothetical protein RLZZ520_1654 [Bacteroidota bacterium]
MKRILIAFSIILIALNGQAQMGVGTATPNASAQLDVSSTNKGFLAPRMTRTQRLAIPSPATGLLVFQTDDQPNLPKGFYYYSGSAWIAIGAGGAGTPGADGKSILSGTVNPGQATGVDGDFYINTTSNTFFGPKASGTWPAGISLVGPQGTQGPMGAPGIPGLQGLQGVQGPAGAIGPAGADGAPGAQGPAGPVGPAGANGAPGAQGPAGPVGPAGAQGPAGPVGPAGADGTPGAQGPAGPAGSQGPAGPAGTDGKTILHGNVDPNPSTGVNGDFYINTTDNKIFGPKASDTWPAGVSLIGIASIGDVNASANTKAASLTAGVLSLSPADGTNPGIVTTAAQTFAGAKTFSSDIKVNGISVGRGNNSAKGNTAIGNYALENNTQYTPFSMFPFQLESGGFENTAIGEESMRNNTSGMGNTAIGLQSLYNNTTGTFNVAIGYKPIHQNTTGAHNIAIGQYSSYNNTTANHNISIGSSSLTANTIGSDNISIGTESQYQNDRGNRNITLGKSALWNNVNGSSNVAIGAYAQYAGAYGMNTDFVTAIGDMAGYNNQGNNNTFIGKGSDLSSQTSSIINATAIGYEAKVNASNTIQLGNSLVTKVSTSGTLTAGAVTYPNTDGTAGQVLTTNGTGTLAWSTVSGVSSVGSILGSSTAEGASISSGVFSLSPADGTNPGIVTTAAQTFAGAKTFSSNLTAPSFTVDGGTSSQFLKADGTVDGTTYVPKNTTKISIGSSAAGSNQGNSAVAIGQNAGQTTQGETAVAIGAFAGSTNQKISAVAIGAAAGNSTQGEYSVAIGDQAGFFNQGNNSVAIGNAAGRNGQGQDAIAIGNGAGSLNQSANSIILNASGTRLTSSAEGFYVKPIRSGSGAQSLFYDSNTGEITYGSNIAYNEIKASSIFTGALAMSSDKRLKTNIVGLPNSLDLINKLNPVSYKKKDSIASTAYKYEEMGFIAQEIQKVLPMLVIEGADKDKTLSVNYVSLIPLLTKGIQQQQAQISSQQKEIDELKKMVEMLLKKNK